MQNQRARQRAQARRKQRRRGGPAPQRQPRRPAPRRRRPVAGALLLVLAGLLALGAASFAWRLPQSVRAADRFAHAPSCAATPRDDCRATAWYDVVVSHTEYGRNASNWITLRDPAAPETGLLTVHMNRPDPVLDHVRPGDRVQVASWQGHPVTVTGAGHTQYAFDQPTDAPCLELSFAVAFLLAGAASASRGLRLRRADAGEAQGSGPLLLALGTAVAAVLAGAIGGGARSFGLTVGVLTGILTVSGLWAYLLRRAR